MIKIDSSLLHAAEEPPDRHHLFRGARKKEIRRSPPPGCVFPCRGEYDAPGCLMTAALEPSFEGTRYCLTYIVISLTRLCVGWRIRSLLSVFLAMYLPFLHKSRSLLPFSKDYINFRSRIHWSKSITPKPPRVSGRVPLPCPPFYPRPCCRDGN
jgi:hypothetical protein